MIFGSGGGASGEVTSNVVVGAETVANAVVREGLAEVVVGSHGRVLRGYGTLLPSSPPYEQPIHKSTHSPFDRRLTQVLQSSRSWPCAQQRAWGQRTVAALRRFLEGERWKGKGSV